MKAYLRFKLLSWCWVAVLAISVLPSDGFAQDNDPQARAEAIIDRLLDNLKSGTTPLSVQIDDDYELSQDGDTFSTTFETFTATDEEFAVDVGPVTLTITPGDEGLSEVDAQIGESIVIRQGDQETARISIGEQTGQGIWDDALENFTSIDMQLVKLSLQMPDNPVQAELAGLDYSASLATEDDQTWTSRNDFQASALSIKGPEGQSVELGMLSADFSSSGSDYQQLLDFTEQLQTTLSREQLENASDPAVAQEIISTLAELYGFFQGFEGNLTLSDFAVAQGDTGLGAFASLGFGIDFNAGDDGASFGYSIDLQGLETPMAPVPPGLLPQALRLEVGLTDIPEGLLERVGELLDETQGMSPEEQQALVSRELMGVVMQSDLGAYIRETYVAAPDARIDLNVQAQVAPGSPFGATGDVDLRIVGLDQAVQGAGLDQDPEIAPALAMVTAFSNRTEEEGKVIDSFALQVTEDGKLMLNGKDVSGMLMGTGAAPAPEDEESTTE